MPATADHTDAPAPAEAAPTHLPKRFSEMEYVHEHTAVSLERAGLTHAFPIQELVVPAAASGRDVMVKAPTGSGKTLAFGLPIIHQLPRGGTAPIAIILVPSRELAQQVAHELNPIAWSKQIRCVPVFGGAKAAQQAKKAAVAPIVVATPGRLLDFAREGKVDLSQAEVLVLDEADRMLDMGFQPDVDAIVELMPNRQQTLFFSATLGASVTKLGARYMENPRTIESSAVVGAANEVEHELLATSLHAKVDTVLAALADPERDQALVFVRTQHGAENLKNALREYGHRSTTIHGGMTQHERLREYKLVKQNVCDILVATDVFARGMDLDRVTHVINYELPDDADAYLHRAGRTGRAGRAGVVMTLVPQKQRARVEGLLEELELPHELLSTMRPAPNQRFDKVAEEDRYRDPIVEDERHPNARESRRDESTFFAEGGSDSSARAKGRISAEESAKSGSRAPQAEQRAAAAPRRPKPEPGAAKRTQAAAGEGTVMGYDDSKGFGFIKPAGGGKDVFFHRSTLEGREIARLRPGIAVKYELMDGLERGKVRASKVTLNIGGRARAPKASGNVAPTKGGPAAAAARAARGNAAPNKGSRGHKRHSR